MTWLAMWKKFGPFISSQENGSADRSFLLMTKKLYISQNGRGFWVGEQLNQFRFFFTKVGQANCVSYYHYDITSWLATSLRLRRWWRRGCLRRRRRDLWRARRRRGRGRSRRARARTSSSSRTCEASTRTWSGRRERIKVNRIRLGIPDWFTK